MLLLTPHLYEAPVRKVLPGKSNPESLTRTSSMSGKPNVGGPQSWPGLLVGVRGSPERGYFVPGCDGMGASAA